MFGRMHKREAAAPLPPGTPRILLVDDDEDEIALVRDTLSRAGVTYQVDWASTYEQGLDQLQDHYEVGLVDYRLGSWSGLDFLREARDRGNRVPLIMLTGERDLAIDQAATGLGAVDFLQKGKTSSEEFERAVRFAAATGRALETARLTEVRMGAIEEIGRVLANDGVSTESIDAIVGVLADRFGRPYLSLYMAEGDQFRLIAQRGHGTPFSAIGRGGQLTTALRMRKPWVVPNQSADPEARTADDPPMELCLPLLDDSATLGLLFVGYSEDAPIGEPEVASLLSVATRIADAVLLANEQRDISGRSVRMRRIGGFLAQLATTTSRAQLEAQLAPAAAEVVDVTSVMIGVATDADHLRVVSSHGVGAPAVGEIVERDSITRRALRESRPASVAEPPTQRLDGRTSGPGRWSAALPLVRGGQTFGVVQFARPERPFDVYERETVTFYAALVALLLSNSASEA